MLHELARDWVGTKWRAGQSKKGVSCDCVGLVVGVGRESGLTLNLDNYPQVPQDESLHEELNKYCTLVENVQNKKPGDILTFKIRGLITHVGFLDVDNWLIHADMRTGVVRVPLGFWERRIRRVYRINCENT